MRSKLIWIIVLTITSLTNCEDRFDFLDTTSFAVIVGLNGQSVSNLTDSIKVSIKGGTDRYKLSLFVDAIEGSNIVASYTLSGVANFLNEQNVTVANEQITLSNGENIYYLQVTEPGEVSLSFRVKDDIGNNTSTFRLVAFDNLPPIAQLDITHVNNLSSLEYELDASSSFDQDFRFGGSIQGYRYKIDTADIYTDKDKVKVIFPSKGSFEVSLEVIDFNEAWSSPQITTFTIE